jgi:hypothetical protein
MAIGILITFAPSLADAQDEPPPPPETTPAGQGPAGPTPATPAPYAPPPEAAPPVPAPVPARAPAPRLRYEDPPPRGRRLLEQPAEPGLSALQTLAGAGTAVGGLLVGVASAEGAPPLGLALTLGLPVLVGGVVCAVGDSHSAHYQGSCGSAILGAYVGTLSVIPLAYVGYQLDHSGMGNEEGDILDGLGGLLVGAAVGLIIVQPLVATAMWHSSKKPKGYASAPPLLAAPVRRLPRPPEPAVRARARGQAAGQLTLPLLSTTF